MDNYGDENKGLPDQYADGKAAKLWELYVGDKNSRTDHYKNFLIKLLHEKNCVSILDVACGTGIDSVMLVEEGFEVTSVDASDKMLKYALKTRWNRRKEPHFENWVIDEANWLSLSEDVESLVPSAGGFDALMCLGNSFAHLPDFTGDQRDQKQALRNFAKLVRPGGILIIDHRNYDFILDTGKTPSNNIYYNSQHISAIETSILHKDGQPKLITMDYIMDTSNLSHFQELAATGQNRFRLSYHPHRLNAFSEMLNEAFGFNGKHTVYGDFKEFSQIRDPAFYIHVMEKV